jgi:hypothetical protein
LFDLVYLGSVRTGKYENGDVGNPGMVNDENRRVLQQRLFDLVYLGSVRTGKYENDDVGNPGMVNGENLVE